MTSDSIIHNFFINILTSGLDLGLTSTYSCIFMLPYIIATKKHYKSALDSILFLFLGRMLFFAFAGGLIGFYHNFFNFFYYDTNYIYYFNILFGGILVLWGGLLILSGVKRYKILDILYKWDHLFMFFLGILNGTLPNISAKLFFPLIILNTNSYILGLISGMLFGLISFISPMIIMVLILGYISKIIYLYFEGFYYFMQKISGALIIYFGMEFIINAWFLIYGNI